MITAATAATLNMLRKAARPIPVAVPTKRPHGGRPNPCATHRDARHGAAIASENYRRNRRGQQLGKGAVENTWDLFVEAVLGGQLPVGQPLTQSAIVKAIGKNAHLGVAGLALNLSTHRCPVRISEIGKGKWVIKIL